MKTLGNDLVGTYLTYEACEISALLMDDSPISQTFEFGKSISTAGKSILNFIQLPSLVAKYCKMWKI